MTRAVLVSIVDHKGELRLSLDDVEAVAGDEKLWKQDVHYTSEAITEADLLDLKFDDKYLAQFGYYVLARLYAFKKRGEI